MNQTGEGGAAIPADAGAQRNKSKGGARGGPGKRKGKKGAKHEKPKMTKEQRRAKYTKLARDRRDRDVSRRKNRNVVCFRCRKRGHPASECTEANADGEGEGEGEGEGATVAAGNGPKVCYLCGSTEHGLGECPQNKRAPRTPSGRIDYARMDLPYAQCFVCGETGHLASQCEKNEGKGIFVNGGGCRICGSKLHIAADCPNGKRSKKKDEKTEADSDDAASVDKFLSDDEADGKSTPGPVRTLQKENNVAKKKRKAVKF